MMTSNQQIQTKQLVIKNLQSLKTSKFFVMDMNTTQDRKDLSKEIENLMKRKSVSIIVVEGDR
tara:strand:+ start:367 stop:555 length:189 start_codon:yes stop_codon:yes gene_type:complete